MLNNKHVVAALLIVPLLSLLAWFAVDKLLSEQPGAAVAGQVYPLRGKSNCRYASGVCELQNGDVELTLKLRSSAVAPVLELRSSVPLQKVLVALVTSDAGDRNGEGPGPAPMAGVDASGTLWHLPLGTVPATGSRLRLVASTSENHFTAEVATEFARLDG